MWKRAAVAAKVEASPGTPESLSWSTNAIRVIGATIPERGFLAENDRDDAITGLLDTPEPAAPAAEFARVSLRFPLIGAGAAYAYSSESSNTLPECHPLLRAAAMSLAVSGGAGSEKATYSQNDDPTTAITLCVEVAGKKWVLTFCQAESFRTIWAAGHPAMAEGTYVGILSALTEQALESATYDSFTAAPWPIVKGASSLVIGSYQPEFQEVTVDHGLSTGPILNGNATDAHGGYKTTNRRMIATVEAYVPALSTWDPMADEKARTPRTFDMAAGTVLYKRVKFDADAAVARGVNKSLEGEFVRYTAPYQLTPAAAVGSLVFD